MAFVMVLSLVPAVSAAGGDLTAAVGVNGLTVTHGDTESVNNPGKPGSGNVEWSPIGSQITAVAEPYGEQVSATLTFKNELGCPATLSFRYELDHLADPDPDVDDRAEVLELEGDSGTFEMELENGESYTITLISPLGGYDLDPATLTITNIALSTGGDVTATFAPAENGSYTVDGDSITANTDKTNAVGTSYPVSATAASGYQFFGWYDGTKYLSYKAEDNLTVNENCTISPVFIKDTVAVFGVGIARFQSLTEADAYAASGAVKTIVLMNDGILTGEHTISAGNTLLIPYDAANTVHTAATPTAIPPENKGGPWTNVEWERPEPYRTLTMAADAKITVNGSLNVGGRHSAGPFLTAGSPSGDLGMIQMAKGSNITVNNGGTLYCWGYIYGDGTVTVKNGGAAHENFQFSDFRGGNITLGLATSFLVFPISQYYVQNIEVAATFEQGASEYVWGSIYLQGEVHGTSVKFIGDDPELCMFVPGTNGTVTKTYDPVKDRLIIDVDGDGSINPMGLELGGTKINTATFVLPINSNMTINVNSGVTALNQSLALLPGVKLTIADGAILSVKSREPLKNEDGTYVHYSGANNLIVYDRDQWFKAYHTATGNIYNAELKDAKFVYTNPAGFKRLQPVAWSPTKTGTRTEADLVDAVVDINGKLITEGFIYTTIDLDLPKYFAGQGLVVTGGGAAVTSSNGTGKLIMNNGAGSDSITLQPYQNTENVEFAYIPMLSARLQNADGSYVDTYTAARGAVFSYCEKCGQWIAGTKANHPFVEITWIVDNKPYTQEVCIGAKPVYTDGTDPVKDGFEFIGWATKAGGEAVYTSANLPEVTVEVTYWACFKEKATGLLGDLNGDKKIDAKDLTLLARHIGGIQKLTGQALESANVDGKAGIAAEDLTTHARYVAGIIKEWP